MTPDGYYLSLQQIPHGIKNKNQATKGIVFLQHGLNSDSASWVLNPPNESLSFVLADAGYEVWMGNDRGDGLSMRNKYYTPDQSEFWNFTYDQMAQYDLPTMINFTLANAALRNQKTLAYIGISEGTIIMFAGASRNYANIADSVNLFIALAPVAYVYHQRSPIMQVLAELDTAQILELLGDHEFYLPNVIETLLPDICKINPQDCDWVLSLLMGPSTHINTSRIPYYLNYQPNPTSILNMVHWSQGAYADVFQMFDYGTPEGNKRHYNQSTPPQYELSKIKKSLPIALFTGGNDYLADPLDVARLIKDLPTAPVLIHNEPSYSHVDYAIAPDAATRAYPIMINLLNKYSNTNRL